FGPRAPSRVLPFPAGANLTSYEILAFLPNAIHCADVVYRFVSNGAGRHVLWVIVNTARDFPDEWHANCCGTYMYKAMKAAGYDAWTVTTHNNWHDARRTIWDEAGLDVTDFRTPSEVHGEADWAENIPFASLAVDVRRMPQGNDALDLTRMVQHCVRHPQEKWMYPRDYAKLLSHIGGPVPIRPAHTDRTLFERWEHKTPPPPRVWTEEEIEAANSLRQTRTKRKRASGARLLTPDSNERSGEATPTRTVKRTREVPKRRARLEEINVDDGVWEEDRQSQVEIYQRAPAEYVAPPKNMQVSSHSDVELAFAAEGTVEERDAYSAYAFGGPRHSGPYRMLHHMGRPHPEDISGWAENLRWAFEQRACFWHTVETERWNESPIHMELIVKARVKQDWASDELLENIPEAEAE
ncbi:hypothetical protein EK21DRAFT_48352, partial [Setomelanomma holmii]